MNHYVHSHLLRLSFVALPVLVWIHISLSVCVCVFVFMPVCITVYDSVCLSGSTFIHLIIRNLDKLSWCVSMKPLLFLCRS